MLPRRRDTTATAAPAYPLAAERLPDRALDHGPYVVRFARDEADLEAVLRLRYRVFNLEMGEGLEASRATGLDRDEFDAVCHHLMVTDTLRNEIVGTYRLQTFEMAESHRGFYSQQEFDLGDLPREVLAGSVELGRACIAASHRNRQVLFLLWKGLALYLTRNRKRYLFGCSSLTSQDPAEGGRMLAFLRDRGHLHPTFVVPPRPGFECHCEVPVRVDPAAVEVPKLFKSYLRYGARICGPPAIDRAFKTLDFFMLLDLEDFSERSYKLFFEEGLRRGPKSR